MECWVVAATWWLERILYQRYNFPILKNTVSVLKLHIHTGKLSYKQGILVYLIRSPEDKNTLF